MEKNIENTFYGWKQFDLLKNPLYFHHFHPPACSTSFYIKLVSLPVLIKFFFALHQKAHFTAV